MRASGWRAARVLGLVVALALAGCSAIGSPTRSAHLAATPTASPSATSSTLSSAAPSAEPTGAGAGYDLWLNNSTPLSLVIVVNGDTAGEVPAMTQTSFAAVGLPGLPWTVKVNAANGKQVMSLDVPAGVVWSTTAPNGGGEVHGAGKFIDLACGRIDVWVGPPLGGPVPGPDVPPCEPFE
jgi:hypothetical protein